MGNAQSTEEPRRASQRLSKPRTGNHATAGLLSPGVFSNSSRRFSQAQLPNPPAPSSTVASTPTTLSVVEVPAGPDRRLDSLTSLQSGPGSQKGSKRRSLFRSRSTRVVQSPPLAGFGDGPGSRMVERMSRASSMTYESAVAYYGRVESEPQITRSDSRASWNYNLTSYEAKRLLNLDEEPHDQTTAMSENRTTAVTENTWKSSNPIPSSSNAPIARTDSDVSLYMPVRRRSTIRTPGVATRSASTNRELSPRPRVSVRHSLPPTPSLSRKQSVESYRSGIVSMPALIADPESTLRAVTPCEDKYLSIGAFKLGSLRITNGTPSPLTPELDNSDANGKWGAGQAAARDGYFAGTPLPASGAANIKAPHSARSPGLLSPVHKSLTPSPVLQTTSKVAAEADRLFDDEPQLEYSSVEILDVRLDPSAKAPHAQPESDAATSVTRTDSGFVSTTSPGSEASYKALSKADSGYSSNVSLRSLHGKSKGTENARPAVPEKTSTRGLRTQKEPVTLEKRKPLPGVEVSSPAGVEEDLPPPVPPKDAARYSSGSRLSAKNTPGSSIPPHSPRGGPEAGRSKTMPHMPHPLVTLSLTDGIGSVSSNSDPRSPASVKSPSTEKPGSPRSAGRGTPKTSRLHRLLSSARRPTANSSTTQPVLAPQSATSAPAVQETEQSLIDRAARLPATARRLVLKSRPSLDTLKTIFSVGSFETQLESANPTQTPTSYPSDIRGSGAWKQPLNSATAHLIPRKPITRKPVPVRLGSASETQRKAGSSLRHSVLGVTSAEVPPVPEKSGRRTMSLTSLGEHVLQAGYRASGMNLPSSTADLPSPPLPSPVAKALAAERNSNTSETAYPARRPASLRIPPSLSRKNSRESLQSYPAGQTLASKASMESVGSYASSRPGAGSEPSYPRPHSMISMDPRRLQSFRKYSPQSPPYSPTREAQTNTLPHRHSQTFSPGGSRRNSITSVQSDGAFYSVNTQGWQFRTTQQQQQRQQSLRHRASYDGYSYQYRSTGYPPSMSNGYTAPTQMSSSAGGRSYLNPAATWSRSQADAAAGQYYQPHPVYVPRGHYRNRSMGGTRGESGPNPPYRVLHSYNSPAYRHAPIWG
ncbi:hypothetical protein B0J18DRAFT_95929 [Chaetomium sp. MPI-SDFR-AT-0129]|nr:hypothetical protein B0J18DRAFT_95929 [Chaetomium sp. MPI-SDFR-AT-0129]